MKEISCRCGASKKRFKYDIGEFFVNDCCLKDFDELGRPKSGDVGAPAQEPKPLEKAPEPKPVAPKAPAGRGKLMDMKIEDLKSLAKEKGIEGADGMTKKQLVAAILQ